jgi:DNA-binding GntR family transcriptional regulator
MTESPEPVRMNPVREVASERVADYLREQILSGEIKPNERIRQDHIAGVLGASRLPVRESLRILEAEGLVDNLPNKGARVTRLDMNQLDVVYRIRELLEPMALGESIPNLTQADLKRLDDIQATIEATTTNPEEFLALNRELHHVMLRGCRSEQLSSMVDRLRNSTQHYRRAVVDVTGLHRRWMVNAEHRLMLDAIRRGDSFTAETILMLHIRRTRTELSAHPEVFDTGEAS